MHILSILAFPSAPQRLWHPPQGLGEQAKVTLLLRTARLNLLTFFQNPPNPPRALPVHDVIHIHWSTLLSGTFILTSVNDTSSPHARQHLCSSLHLTNPRAEPKGSQPDIGKIYKTKSHGHYIAGVGTDTTVEF